MDRNIYDLTVMTQAREQMLPREVSERYEQDHGSIPSLGHLLIFSRIGKK